MSRSIEAFGTCALKTAFVGRAQGNFHLEFRNCRCYVTRCDVVVREYVKKKPLASLSLPGVELNIGSTLPETVEVHRFEETPDLSYEYVVIDNRTVLVEPGTRRIVKV